jgi:Icc-related predicted phosphoesterase
MECFLKMLKAGVPIEAVKMRMKMNGFEASALDAALVGGPPPVPTEDDAPATRKRFWACYPDEGGQQPVHRGRRVGYLQGNDATEIWKRLQREADPAAEVVNVTLPSTPKRPGTTRFVFISDTHGMHRKLVQPLPVGDVLVHTGDFSNTGEMAQIRDFVKWIKAQPHKLKIVIAGNHDTSVHKSYYLETGSNRFGHAHDPDAVRSLLQNDEARGFVYLEDSGTVAPGGLKVWGSPWQPFFCDWAFNAKRGAPCREKWDLIPSDTNILLTHGPPLGRGDECHPGGKRAGCEDLLHTVQTRVRPQVHAFGHVHEGAGVYRDGVGPRSGDILYVNASSVDVRYRVGNPPIVVDIPHIDAGGAAEGNVRDAAC